jgi:hypothetical protein
MPCCGSGVENTVAMQSKEEPAAAPAATTATNQATKAPASDSSKSRTAATPQSPAPVQEAAPTAAPVALAPVATPETPALAPAPAPVASTPVEPTSNVREESKPAWANKEKAGTVAGDSPQPPAETAAPGARPAKNVPTGFVSGTRKDQEISSGVQDRIAGLKASGLKTNNTGGKRMKTPRIITDTKESWDKVRYVCGSRDRFDDKGVPLHHPWDKISNILSCSWHNHFATASHTKLGRKHYT